MIPTLTLIALGIANKNDDMAFFLFMGSSGVYSVAMLIWLWRVGR